MVSQDQQVAVGGINSVAQVSRQWLAFGSCFHFLLQGFGGGEVGLAVGGELGDLVA